MIDREADGSDSLEVGIAFIACRPVSSVPVRHVSCETDSSHKHSPFLVTPTVQAINADARVSCFFTP